MSLVTTRSESGLEGIGLTENTFRRGRLFLRLPMFILALMLVMNWHSAQAVTVNTICVDNSAALVDALTNSNFSPSTNIDIRILQGTYSIGKISYDFIAPTTIRGGYSDANCTQRNPNPYNTVIDLSGASLTLNQPKGPSRASITVDGVTFQHGTSVSLSAGTAYAWPQSNDDGDLTIRRTRITNIAGASGVTDAVNLGVVTGRGVLENVLVDHVEPGTDGVTYGCALDLFADGSDAGFDMNFVTGDFWGMVCLSTGPTYYITNIFEIHNSIFWHSAAGLPSIVSWQGNSTSTFSLQISYSLVHTVYGTDGKAEPPFTGQIDADPQWISPATGSYGLGAGSPAIDAGDAQTVLGMPSNDMIGQARLLGPEPDLGALESNGSVVPTYIVSNTADSGAGSLRQAILDANANSSDDADIIFQLPGGCPQVISLNTSLPDVTSPIRIFGYSQAGAAPNEDPDVFLPTICVLLTPASGTLPFALRVPAASTAGRLDVSGLGFGGFSQALLLLGGSPHRISGNQFGASVGGVFLPGANLNAISVAGISTSGSIVIGGATPGERNVISGVDSGNGINIQSSVMCGSVSLYPDCCRISNNIIGLTPTAVAANPNGWGINIGGDACTVTDNRIAGNRYDAIWVNGGSYNVIQGNRIGMTVDGNNPISQNGYGVRLSGGHDNVIGMSAIASSTSETVVANEIAFMLQGGIAVANPSAYNDSLRGNIIHDIAGLAVDLNNDGPTANDDTDADTGANNLQNYPTTTAIRYLNGFPAQNAQNVPAYFFGKLTDSNSGMYRVDVYFSNDGCAFGQRGMAEHYLGSYPVLISPGGVQSVFNYELSLPNVAVNAAIALTATDSNGNTSEIGDCFPVSQATLLDDIFKDGFGW